MKVNLQKLVNLYDEGNFSDLEKRCKNIVGKGQATPEILNLLALSHKNLGKIELAIAVFKKGIVQYPRDGTLLGNLANIYRDNGAIAEAVECLEKAIELTPKDPNLYNSLGYVYMQREELERACEVFKKALEIEPHNPTNRYNVANIYRKMNNLKAAIKYFEGIDIRKSQSHMAECMYIDGQYEGFIKKLEELNDRDVTDPLVGALTEHARITLDLKTRNAFCSRPISHIYRANIDLSGPTGETLEVIKSFAIRKELDYKTQAQQALLINGVQSPGNLLDSNQPFVEPLRKILELSVTAYRKKFANSSEPFIRHWPRNYLLYAWLVLVKNEGFLRAHIHKEGWLSGSLYLEIPKTEILEEGAISFGLHGANYPDFGKTFKDHPVEIKEGMVCMFPSSLFHKTIPFQSHQTRVSLAFDVIPD